MTIKTEILSMMTVAAALAAQGQTSTPSATPSATATVNANAPKLSPLEQSIQDIKNPTPWLSWGADLRLRNEYYNNDRTLKQDKANHEQDYFRIRPRLWTSITPIKDLSLNARITTEMRDYVDPSDSSAFNLNKNPAWSSSTKGYYGYDWAYGIIDTLNIKYKNIADSGATLTVGRQDFMLNDGWLTGDGTPLDGSTTAYLDAARLTYDFKEQHTTVDAIGLLQYARPDAWLPTINEQHRAVADQNEKGGILNINNTTIKEANVGAYFIYKNDKRLTINPPLGANGDNADIYTVGARVNGVCADHWKYSAEGAYQFGRRCDTNINKNLLDPVAQVNDPTKDYRDISAFGVNSKLSYLFNDSMKNTVGLAYEFLSGDNKNTKNDEMFDVLWGRYARWTDLYTYVYVKENRHIGAYNNYHRFGPTWTLTPVNKLDVSLTYNVLWADQTTPTRNSDNAAFAGGSFRGQYIQSLFRYKFNQHVAALLQGEAFVPGNFYASNKLISFIRAELSFTF